MPVAAALEAVVTGIDVGEDPVPPSRTIVLVGHCGPDVFMLKSAVGRVVPDAPIATANDQSELAGHLGGDALLLVNRELDGDFADRSGVELIRQVRRGESPPIAMLISNYEDAQQQAVSAGAVPGFGKSQLYDARTADLLRAALGP